MTNNVACQKWRDNNREAYREYIREYANTNYDKYRDAAISRNKKRYAYKTECKRLASILLVHPADTPL